MKYPATPANQAAQRAYEMLKEMESHLEDLRQAWQRGALRSYDGDKDGLRSNRNHDLLMEVRKALKALTGEN